MKTRQIETVLLRLVASNILVKVKVSELGSCVVSDTINRLKNKIIEGCVYAH